MVEYNGGMIRIGPPPSSKNQAFKVEIIIGNA